MVLGGNVNLGDFDVSVDYSSLGGASGGVKYEKNLDFLGGNLQFKANAGIRQSIRSRYKL